MTGEQPDPPFKSEGTRNAELAAFAKPAWVDSIAAVPINEVPVMICEDPSVVTVLIGALRHERAQHADLRRQRDFYKDLADHRDHYRDPDSGRL